MSVVCVRSRAHTHAYARMVRSYVRAGEGDRPTEIKSTSGRSLARARGETKVRVSVAAGKERHRRTRGRVTPECPRFLLSVPSLLSLALARSRSPSRESHRAFSLYLSSSAPSLTSSRVLLLALRRLLPIPGVHYLSFFLHFLCPPLVQMARTISRVVPCTVSCANERASDDDDDDERFLRWGQKRDSRNFFAIIVIVRETERWEKGGGG